VVDWCLERPDNNLWILLADGGLACLTYHYEHQVIGARRQQLRPASRPRGCVSPDPDGRDRLHVAGVRTKSGSPQRHHLVLARREEGMFMDCAAVPGRANITTVSGLGHLEGETVASRPTAAR
jgi:hypothetical protein